MSEVNATNILYLINFAGKGGSEKYVDNLVRIFSAKGESCFLAYNVPGELSQALIGRGVPALRLELGRREPLRAAKILAAFCRENSIDVIHAQYPRENILALLSLRWYDKPRVVYTNHLTIRSGLKWRVLNRSFTPRNHAIIAVCREGRDIMLRNGVCPDRVQVIYNGVEPEGTPVRDETIRDTLGVPRDAFLMTILARFEPEKGLMFLLDSLRTLKTMTDRPFVCAICGDGSLFHDVSRRVDELGLRGSVLLTGFRKDAGRILHGSDLYLCSSEYNEAMSFAILEAMNAGLPCVVTDVGGNRDLAETDIVCGEVTGFGDTDAFASAMKSYMDDEEKRAAHSAAACRKIAESFDLNKLAWDVFRAYQ